MTARDRMILIVIGVLAVLGAAWMLAVSPARKQLASLDARVATATQLRDTAAAEARSAQAARATHGRDLATIASLGQALPAEEATASLVYQLQAVAGRARVVFESVTPAAAAAPGSPATAASAPAAGAAPLPAGVTALPVSLAFRGSYFGLERLLRRVQGLAAVDGSTIRVRGRLLAVDKLSLAIDGDRLTADVSAAAYQASSPAAAPASAPGSAPAPAPGPTAAAPVPAAPVATAAVPRAGG